MPDVARRRVGSRRYSALMSDGIGQEQARSGEQLLEQLTLASGELLPGAQNVCRVPGDAERSGLT